MSAISRRQRSIHADSSVRSFAIASKLRRHLRARHSFPRTPETGARYNQRIFLSAVRIGHCEKRKIVKAQSDFLTRLLHQLGYWQSEYWLTSIALGVVVAVIRCVVLK